MSQDATHSDPPEGPPLASPEEETIERLHEGEDNTATTIEKDLAAREIETVKGDEFGTFTGVIRPTILTILGVMMYLREGWVVGNAGLGGTVLILLLAYFITGTTALSLSSITTNIRLGAGGVFSIATQSLGLEVGGSIGIPFYLAQTLSVAMYTYGFTEGWVFLFPEHPPTLVALAVFAVVFLLSYISTSLAFRAQLLVMAGVVVALVSIFGAVRTAPLHSPQLVGAFEDASFWTLFAVFFPASTGIMVGASLSGSLKNPRRSIPVGTMTAWGVSLLVYLALAVWYSVIATPEELRTDLTVAVDKALWGPGVLIGILASCFTAALSSLVASPRTLQALGKHRIVPFGGLFSALHRGEPRNAIAATGAIVVVILLFGDLNSIARIVTVFFLMTYFTVNAILAIEKQLNLISFRPLFKVPKAVPILGALSCLGAIVVVSPVAGLLCVLLSIGIYIFLDRRSLETPYETLNSGLFEQVADWAAARVAGGAQGRTLRSWKPDILVPITRTTQLEGNHSLLVALTRPQGSVQVLGIHGPGQQQRLRELDPLIAEFKRERLLARSALLESGNFRECLRTSATVMSHSFFRPNVVFCELDNQSDEDTGALLEIAEANEMGFLLLANHPEAGFGLRKRANLFISDQSPDWHLSFDLANIDLQLLMAIMLMRNWGMRLRVLTLVSDPAHQEPAEQFLHDLMVLARMPPGYEVVVEHAAIREFLPRAPRADLNMFGLAKPLQVSFAREAPQLCQSSCLFVRNSGRESVLV